MDSKLYQENTALTENMNTQEVVARLGHKETRLVHHAMGMAGEAGEVLDIVKKGIFYGKPLDKEKLVEEVGDVLWYMTRLADTLECSLEDIMTVNNAKLSSRYQKGYSDKAAVDRADEAS